MTITAEEAAAVDLSLHPTWCVAMVRDEIDVIEGTLRHLAGEGVAGIVIADNGSTDGTLELLYDIADDLACPVEVLEDHERAYYQSRKMSALATIAGEQHGAEWIVPFDADELWLAPHALARFLGAQPRHVNVVRAALYHHLCTAVDVEDPDPFRAMVWRQGDPAALPKVAFRWRDGATLEAGNHGVMLPHRRSDLDPRVASVDGLEVRHFPYRSAAQMTRKAKNGAEAYAATDLPDNVGAHWRQYGELIDRYGDQIMERVFEEHFHYLVPTEDGLVRDPAAYRRWEAWA